MPPVEKMALVAFFLSYRWELTIPASLLWTVSWKTGIDFNPQGLKKTHLVFLCDTAWLWYPLEDGERWPVGGSLKYNTVVQLDRFCNEQGKWVEVAYALPFSSLWNMPDLCPKGIDLGVKPYKEKKKNRFLQSIPGIISTEQPERLRNSHISCCLFMKRNTHRKK